MTKNCEFCHHKFVQTDPRKRFCSKRCVQAAWRERNLPNRGAPSSWAVSSYWLTAKGYRAIGKRPPRAVTRTDKELGILG